MLRYLETECCADRRGTPRAASAILESMAKTQTGPLADEALRSLAFDRVAGEYDETRGLPPGVDAQVADLFARAGGLRSDSRVLEIGIGTGRIALALSRRVGTVFGVDLSRPMLARLEGKRSGERVRAVRADATRLPYRDASFDAAVAVHVFHLIPDWRRALREVTRALRPGAPLLHGWTGVPAADLLRVFEPRGLENRGVREGERERFLAESGWRRVGEPERLEFVKRIRPAEVVEMVERRTFSRLWELPDESIAALAERLRDELANRFGDLDAEVDLAAEARVERWLPPT
ncbi:Demethylrebeccamycin-D-glucose O-methyltransferase [Myxococcaceae bacterium]|nr:Demethylrebeccamycin-D-glucose O-methyltransferase [Myxococcaceae bacterium]